MKGSGGGSVVVQFGAAREGEELLVSNEPIPFEYARWLRLKGWQRFHLIGFPVGQCSSPKIPAIEPDVLCLSSEMPVADTIQV
jgi:hypothetical protein